MRSLFTRAAAVLAVASGALVGAPGVAFADDHPVGDPIAVSINGSHVVEHQPVDNDGIGNGNQIFAPINLVLILDDINVLGVIDQD